VGGTNLVTTASTTTLESRYVAENAYGDPDIPYDPYGLGATVSGGYWGSGGGVSQVFAQPAYQRLVPTFAATRAVPDVALHEGGCPAGIAQLPCGTPRSSVVVAFGGSLFGVIGTSVSAPEFAGLLALAEEGLGGERLGNVNPLLYLEAAAQAANPRLAFFHDQQPGFNGFEFTRPIYNKVLGVGTPYGLRVILQPNLPAAGTPQTPSNP
jgi:subtilase family serine protease